MNEREIKTQIIDKAEIIAKEIKKGNDISITKSPSGLKIMSETKKTIR